MARMVLVLKRLTTLRKSVLDIIDSSSAPLNAENIHGKLRDRPDLSSVYRSLSFLEERGLIRSVSFECETRYYFGAGKEPVHFIHCKKCHRTESFHGCFAAELEESVRDDHDFTITDHVFYFIGICGDCKRKMMEELEGGKL
jgi:Fur family ferric uptake transcriptional regulator